MEESLTESLIWLEPFLEGLLWKDLFDICILAFIFYQLLILIKGTRTMPILVGFSLVLGFYFLSQFLKLEATGLLLDNIANSLMLVLVIIFQADIRNALAQFGLITFFTGGRFKRDLVDEVLQGCVMMAQQRIGALVVFEREMGLRNIVEKGTLLQAATSKELLLAIFHPTSPLHDGAIILDRKGNIISARCVLPITMKTSISPILGTRHRAAVGLTEETDAVVLVVSEERSEISLSYKGQLLRGTSSQDIKQVLFEILEGKRSDLGEDIEPLKTTPQGDKARKEKVIEKEEELEEETSVSSTV